MDENELHDPAPVHVSAEWIADLLLTPTNEQTPFALDWEDKTSTTKGDPQ